MPVYRSQYILCILFFVSCKMWSAEISLNECAELLNAIKEDNLRVVFWYSFEKKDFITKCVYKLGKNIMHIYAKYSRNKDIFSVLKFIGGADINKTDLKGRTPLMYAAIYGNEVATYFLATSLNPKTDITAEDASEKTALDYAKKNAMLIFKSY
jgi:ankyrin repeat protein